jgi:hypothetical protein
MVTWKMRKMGTMGKGWLRLLSVLALAVSGSCVGSCPARPPAAAPGSALASRALLSSASSAAVLSVRHVGRPATETRTFPKCSPFYWGSLRSAAQDTVSVQEEKINLKQQTEATETFAFESNVGRVMDIIINSLYSNKDIFLRELISNAADACDKKRYRLNTNQEPPGAPDSRQLSIRVKPDRKLNTLTIEDNGVGMNKQELVQNLGRIAESGTKRFSDSLKVEQKQNSQSKDAVSNLVGQFGVGFYSAFLVADKITVISKGSDGKQLRWEAEYNSLGSYTISADVGPEAQPIEGPTGTRIILKLKPECDHYADDISLNALIEKYSEFAPFPIE